MCVHGGEQKKKKDFEQERKQACSRRERERERERREEHTRRRKKAKSPSVLPSLQTFEIQAEKGKPGRSRKVHIIWEEPHTDIPQRILLGITPNHVIRMSGVGNKFLWAGREPIEIHVPIGELALPKSSEPPG